MDETGLNFKVDDIVLPEERKQAQQYECPICISIPSSSVQTVCCSAIFCSECLDPLVACPNCRADFEPGKKTAPLPTLVKRMLDGLNVRCPFGSFDAGSTGRVSGGGGSSNDKVKNPKSPAISAKYCDWTGSYGDLVTKHIGRCGFCQVLCPDGCGQRVRRDKLDEHKEGCAKTMEECSICKALVKPGGMPEHRYGEEWGYKGLENRDFFFQPGNVVGTLDGAGQSWLGTVLGTSEFAPVHVLMLEQQLSARDEECGLKSDLAVMKIQNQDLQNSVTEFGEKFETMKKDLTHLSSSMPGAIGCVKWTLKKADYVQPNITKGVSVDSPTFVIGTKTQFCIMLYPKGEGSSEPGKAGIFVRRMSSGADSDTFGHATKCVLTIEASGGELPTKQSWQGPLTWDEIYGAFPSGLGWSSTIEAGMLEKAAETVMSLEHEDGEKGRVVHIGSESSDVVKIDTVATRADLRTVKAELLTEMATRQTDLVAHSGALKSALFTSMTTRQRVLTNNATAEVSSLKADLLRELKAEMSGLKADLLRELKAEISIVRAEVSTVKAEVSTAKAEISTSVKDKQVSGKGNEMAFAFVLFLAMAIAIFLDRLSRS